MKAQLPQRPARSATTGYSQRPQCTRPYDLGNISASDFNQIRIELEVIRTDFDRIYGGYKQIGTAFAELLLDQPQAWRNYLLDNVYVWNFQPDVRQDVATFLETVELHDKLKGANRYENKQESRR